jgi:transposase
MLERVIKTLKDWKGQSHLKTRRLKNVRTEISLHILPYYTNHAIALISVPALMAAMGALAPAQSTREARTG